MCGKKHKSRGTLVQKRGWRKCNPYTTPGLPWANHHPVTLWLYLKVSFGYPPRLPLGYPLGCTLCTHWIDPQATPSSITQKIISILLFSQESFLPPHASLLSLPKSVELKLSTLKNEILPWPLEIAS